MPKIIENLEARLMEEAEKQLRERGYGALTIRDLAKACGVGVGTVYNYFPSKEALVAKHLLTDWNRCVAAIESAGEESHHVRPVILCIHQQLLSFSRRHMAIFRDEAAAAGFAGSFSRYHGVLRAQLAAPLRKFCSGDFPAEFIAEALLTWTMAGKSFDEIYGMLERLF